MPRRRHFCRGRRPADQLDFIQINAELSHQWPSITRKKPYPDDADEWVNVPNKRQYLKR